MDRLAEQTARFILFELVSSALRQKIDQTPKISMVFKFEWDKIKEFLQKFEAQMNKAPLPKIPDIKNYLKKKRREMRDLKSREVQK